VSPFLSSPRSGITVSPRSTKSRSFQTICFQHDAHSFAQRRQPIPRPFNNLRTLLPLTASFFSTCSSAPSANSCFAAFSFPFSNSQPLCDLQKSQLLWNQTSAASFCKTPGVGGVPFSTFRRSDLPTFGPERLSRWVARHSPLVTRYFPAVAAIFIFTACMLSSSPQGDF